MSTHSWVEIKAKLREAILWLPNFFANPVQGMRQLPDWDWPTLLILPPSFALACGTIKNLIERDVLGLFTDILIAPLAAVVVTGIVAAWFFYGFKFFFHREIPFRAIYTHLVFAAIPAQVTNIATKYIPLLNFPGLVVSIYLLHIGFVHNFTLDSRRLKHLFIGLFTVFVLWWAVQFYKVSYHRDSLRIRATPESLDILEKELNPPPVDH